ncbi:helix-turn-helix domain-containing protein [Alicyclobacillus fastidiosus]|uniref:Helix-turn-helix transcriptional regulator n=1 Tax=Alicyclobacillus fastidiosus TaxID=392011 RepID=A0ABV5ADX6_9BACL|nr:helix-turn-helix transcriptional regulator [Alicyclobacillus fastidiosus]WEH09956.1 helix-turn-helix transcriptional regulator [Alicyclobacillus fastidiosus]
MSDVFGRKMRAYRKLKHMTQIELAEHLGVSVAIVGSLERGTRTPSPQMIRRLTEVLNVTEAELFGDGEGDSNAMM